jgi:hypothetical protein
MTCHDCRHALMRSERPDKHYSYECCELGHWFLPSAPDGHHDCREWTPGKAKKPQGIDIIFGEDIEL